MNTPRVNWNPAMTKQAVDSGLFRDAPFCLVDVGASGGIDGYWEVFGDGLTAFGFDPLIKEVERMKTAARPGRHYHAYVVGDKSYQVPTGVPYSQPFTRTSAVRAAEIQKCNYVTTYFDQTGSGEYATEMIELDQFFLRDHPVDVDFIKIDTDGSDYQVLRGTKELLSAGNVLGLAVESQFHGPAHEESNTFRNIDRMLTGLGFSLFDLEVYRYSRRALPKPFVYRIPAQTESGQVMWADALYLRDEGKPELERGCPPALSPHKILKLACLFEIFGLNDCAVELLLKYRADIGHLVDVGGYLDTLTPHLHGQRLSYREYIRSFEQNPESFYPPK
jgi:FkbM family methyltransferase